MTKIENAAIYVNGSSIIRKVNHYSALVVERSIAISLSVCLSVREYISGTVGPIFTNILCGSPVAVARSSLGGVAICYVLPVLWLTSRWAVMGRTAMRGRLNL